MVLSGTVVRIFLAQGYLSNQESRKTTKSHHATNLTQKVHWGETQGGGCLWMGRGTAEVGRRGGLLWDLLEHVH